MTKQVEELTRGEALTRVAVLEAELAELRKRVCVPDGYKVVPVEPTPEMLGATSWPGCAATDYKHMLAAAHAPVEWVEHDHDAIALKKARDIMQIMYGEMPKGGSTQLLAMVQECVLEAMSHVCTPQPTPTTAQDVEDPWKASGVEYDRAIHHNPDAKAWADLFVQTFPAQADQHELMLGWFANAMMAMHDWLKTKESPAPTAAPDMAEVIPRPVIDWAETGALDYRDSWSTRINGHTVGLHSDEERARNHAWALEAYLGMHKIIAAHHQREEQPHDSE